MSEYIISENSWPLFVYENYQVNHNNLKEGFLKSKLLVLVSGHSIFMISSLLITLQAFKAIFTSPSSAKEAEGDGYGADILENSRCAQWKSQQTKVKTCIASITNMKKVMPCAITYVVCQVSYYYCHYVQHLTLMRKVCFTLSSVTSWRSMDGDFDYEAFWSNIVDFFEDIPSPVMRRKVDKLLEWWTR
jgi:hypothetical protein